MWENNELFVTNNMSISNNVFQSCMHSGASQYVSNTIMTYHLFASARWCCGEVTHCPASNISYEVIPLHIGNRTITRTVLFIAVLEQNKNKNCSVNYMLRSEQNKNCSVHDKWDQNITRTVLFITDWEQNKNCSVHFKLRSEHN